jgi:hypothetical protein
VTRSSRRRSYDSEAVPHLAFVAQHTLPRPRIGHHAGEPFSGPHRAASDRAAPCLQRSDLGWLRLQHRLRGGDNSRLCDSPRSGPGARSTARSNPGPLPRRRALHARRRQHAAISLHDRRPRRVGPVLASTPGPRQISRFTNMRAMKATTRSPAYSRVPGDRRPRKRQRKSKSNGKLSRHARARRGHPLSFLRLSLLRRRSPRQELRCVKFCPCPATSGAPKYGQSFRQFCDRSFAE